MIINALSKDAHYFTLDVHNGAILTEPLKFKQHDNNSRVLAIELTMHDDMKVDLRDARVDIWVYKQDGHSVVKAVDRDNIDLASSIVMIPLTRQMLAVAPSIQCEIVVTYADKSVLSFPIFTVEIEESNVDTDTLVSSSEFDLFYDALYRMEQWMRDYLVKYDTIDRAFKQKLEAIEQERVRIVAEFEKLNNDLIRQNEVKFEELKQATIGEFNTWLREAKALFAYVGREIEKRFNELEQKATDLCNDIEKMKNTSNENLQVILENRAESDKQLEIITANTTESREQLEAVGELMNETEHRIETLEGRMDEFDEHYRQAKAEELLRTQAENARKSAEEIRVTQEKSRVNAESSRVSAENARNQAETQRSQAETARNQSEQTRINSENTRIANETERQSNESTRKTKESERQQKEDERKVAEQNRVTKENERIQAENTRVQSEQSRIQKENERIQLENTRKQQEDSRVASENIRNTKETERNSSEEQRINNETSRINSENARQQGYIEMKETVDNIYQTTLKYRIVE